LKGLAYPNMAFNATHGAFLAMRGIADPLEVFEDNEGFMEVIAGPFELDWQQENLEIVQRTSVKKYNAEFYAQSVLEGVLELKAFYRVRPEEIERIEVEIFDVAYHIIDGGQEGNKHQVCTKDEADHSLPYLVAVALLDEEVTPAQYRPERIARADVQALLRKVSVRPDDTLSQRFPAAMPCRLRVFLTGSRVLYLEQEDYMGLFNRPFTWEQAEEKFERLAAPYTEEQLRQAIIKAVAHLETLDVSQLTELLAAVNRRSSMSEHFDELRSRGEPPRRSRPDRAARVSLHRPVGPGPDLQREAAFA
jgi:2-methylcitrate dehydratase